MKYISNKKDVIKVEDSQLASFLSQKGEDGKSVWTEVDPPQAAPETVARQVAERGEGTTPLRKGDSVIFADTGQVEFLSKDGWKVIGEEDVPKKESTGNSGGGAEGGGGDPGAGTPGEGTPSVLRKTLEELDPEDDDFWNNDGRVNIGALKTLLPEVTREDVEAEWPDFSRESVQKGE